MALTPSKMLPLGTVAPPFNLFEPRSEKWLSLNDLKAKHGFVVMFLCNHCPYVKHIRSELASFTKQFDVRDIAFVAINSNDVDKFPEDRPEKMKEEAERAGYQFPYLFDETQNVARAYDAACTPDFFLFNANRELFYRGQFDESRPGNGIPVTGSDLASAIRDLLEAKAAPLPQKPSIGCNIKWK